MAHDEPLKNPFHLCAMNYKHLLLNHKNEDFKIFEISNVYSESKNVLVLSAALCGNANVIAVT